MTLAIYSFLNQTTFPFLFAVMEEVLVSWILVTVDWSLNGVERIQKDMLELSFLPFRSLSTPFSKYDNSLHKMAKGNSPDPFLPL